MANLKKPITILKQLVSGQNYEDNVAERTSVTIIKTLLLIMKAIWSFGELSHGYEDVEEGLKRRSQYKWTILETFDEISTMLSMDEIKTIYNAGYTTESIRTNDDFGLVKHTGAYNKFILKGIAEYINRPDGATKTKKNSAFSVFNEKYEELSKYYGIYNMHKVHIPGRERILHRSLDYTKLTEKEYHILIKGIDKLLKIPLKPCSDKQAYYVAEFLECSPNIVKSLNMKQASEILDIAFHYDNYDDFVIEQTVDFYKEKLGLKESLGKKLDRLIKETVKTEINKLLMKG